MTILNTLLILISVLMICVGQLLFKLVGVRIQSGLHLLDFKVWAVACTAIAIYGSATILWIAILRTVPLVKAYPYMALSFVLVPLGSVLFYSEKVHWIYVVGTGLIVIGVILTTLQPKL